MKRSPLAVAAAVIALGMTVSLAACEGQIPTVSAPTESASANPDLTEDQEQEMREALLKTIEDCNEQKNPANLGQAMSGPELEIRTDNGWPRSVFSITTTTEDQQSKRLLVFTQGDARENYKLWGVARLFQGVEMPKFTVPNIGSQMGHPTDENLVMTPEQAVQRYADVLQNGTKSQYAGDFADDYFRQDLQNLSQTVQQGMERNKGSQEQTFTPVDGQMQIMRSSEGGDLVVAQINSVWTRTAGEGRESLPASDSERALFGDGKATSTMKVTYVNVIAMYIPPAKSGAQITTVGAERQPVKVEAV